MVALSGAAVAVGDPSTDDPRCHLFGPTALTVQALMGILVIASLVYKRQRESPRRKWAIWMFDVSKQVVGQAVLHGSNVVVSWLIGKRTLANPCISYFLHILLDTTLGVLIIYSLLRMFTYLLTEKAHMIGLKSGIYGDPPSPVWWMKQSAVYLLCLFIMKTIVIALLELFPFLMRAGKWLLSWTNGKNFIQVIFVMGVFPITMNILQFWLLDSIVKFQTSFTGIDASPEDQRPLVNEQFDDEDDFDETDGFPSPLDIERRPFPPLSPGSSTFLSHSHVNSPAKENDNVASSVPTSTSSKTIIPRRRSPPPSPSQVVSPSSSYGSMGDSMAVQSSRERWRSVEDDDDEHAKWSKGLGFDASELSSAVNAVGDSGRPAPTSPTSQKRWETWRMPEILSPPKQNQPPS